MFGMKHGRLPSGPKLTGAEFREIKDDLYAIFAGEPATAKSEIPLVQETKPTKPQPQRNVPLA